MPLPQPALPNFNVQTPDFQRYDLEQAQLKNMLSETALRQSLAPLQVQEQQQRVQQQEMANELQRIQLQDSRVITDYFKNGNAGEEAPSDFSMRDKIAAYTQVDKNDPIMGFLAGLAKGGMSGPGLLAQAQSMIAKRTEYNKGTEELQTIQKNERLLWQQSLAELRALPEDQRSIALAGKLPLLQENSKSDPLLASYAQHLSGHPELIDQAYNTLSAENAALGLRKAKAETGKAETEAAEAAAEARGEVTPKMKTAQEQEIKKAKVLAPVEVSKAVATEVAKQKALAPQLQQIASTTRNGRNYINREDIPKGSEGVVEQQAAAAGLPIVDKETAGTLTDIDEAKANMQSMLALVQKKLPAGPGERIYKGPANKIEAALQTDPDLAAMGTFRNAAIKTMRAVAGSKGLRINQAEIEMAIDNDIPKMTDTWAVAQSKINQLNGFLDNAEATHLTRNRTAITPAGTGLITLRAPNGQTKQVKPEEVEHYKSLGATVVTK